MHIVHVICMLSAHVHIICLSSVNTPQVYPIIHNLVSVHWLHTCTLSMSSACCLHMYTSFACQSLTLLIYPIIHNLVFHVHAYCTPQAHCQYHLYIVCRCICYVHVLISTAVICICTCHLHIIWAYVYYAHIICSGPWYIPSKQTMPMSWHMSSLVLFIYPIMYNLVSAHCLHKCTLSISFACCPHMYTSFDCHLYHSSYTLVSTT